jgi:penicillin-binding protein 1A
VQDRWGNTIYRHDQRNCVDCAERAMPAGRIPWITSQRARVMDAVTAYQLTSMMQGVVERGTAARTVNLPVPTAGKTGTTNEARDVWFVGYTSNIVAGCYIGFDQPRPLGRGAGGGTMCGPVFNDFMLEAVKKYGGGRFRVPEGGYFIKIDRDTGARLPDSATGANVVTEFFREGIEPIFGLAAIIDGGFSLGSDLPIFAPGESYDALQREDEGQGFGARTKHSAQAAPPLWAVSRRAGCIDLRFCRWRACAGRANACPPRRGALCTARTDSPSTKVIRNALRDAQHN